MPTGKRIALVTGANRGIGFATCKLLSEKGIDVILTSRSVDNGEEAMNKLADMGHDVDFHELDVTDKNDIAAVEKYVREKYSRLDILINNAGIQLDERSNPGMPGILDTYRDVLRESMEVNVYGPVMLMKTFVPLMRENNYGRIVNVSSQMGQLSSMGAGWAGYRISKAALNAATRIFAAELSSTNIKVNSVHPGWVRTRMGGENASRSTAEGARSVVWPALIGDDGPTGGFFYDGKPLEW
jgi:NAD(P)-dependent dehydrogenase (short-subunit alcohol dehydrogenase family)